MSSEARTITTSLRLPPGLIRRIDGYLECDAQFTTRTDLIVEAIRHYLDYRVELTAKELALSEAHSVAKSGMKGGGERTW